MWLLKHHNNSHLQLITSKRIITHHFPPQVIDVLKRWPIIIIHMQQSDQSARCAVPSKLPANATCFSWKLTPSATTFRNPALIANTRGRCGNFLLILHHSGGGGGGIGPKSRWVDDRSCSAHYHFLKTRSWAHTRMVCALGGYARPTLKRWPKIPKTPKWIPHVWVKLMGLFSVGMIATRKLIALKWVGEQVSEWVGE